jgi:cytochrome c oxidase cbb3-type subunit III
VSNLIVSPSRQEPWAFLFLILFAVSASAQSPPQFDASSVARGKQAFVASCGFCHGAQAKGGEKGPDLLRSVLVLHDEGGASIGQVVRNGRIDKGMPKFALNDQQITDIANFLHNSIAAAANRDDYKVLNIVTGNASAGESYFNAHCTSCHSVNGDLKGIGKKYEPLALQGRIVMPQDEGPAAKPVFTVTVKPASGESVEGVVLLLNDFTVALRDQSGTYRSFKRVSESEPEVSLHNRLQGHYDMLKKWNDADIHNLTAYLVTLK